MCLSTHWECKSSCATDREDSDRQRLSRYQISWTSSKCSKWAGLSVPTIMCKFSQPNCYSRCSIDSRLCIWDKCSMKTFTRWSDWKNTTCLSRALNDCHTAVIFACLDMLTWWSLDRQTDESQQVSLTTVVEVELYDTANMAINTLTQAVRLSISRSQTTAVSTVGLQPACKQPTREAATSVSHARNWRVPKLEKATRSSSWVLGRSRPPQTQGYAGTW